MQLRILSAADVRACIDMPAAIEAMRSGFGQLAGGQAVLPQRVALETPGGVGLFMPGYLADDHAAAAKVVSVYPGNAERGVPVIHAVVLVLDPDTGVPLALMDGTHLTALRTGAVGGLGADLLAREDASVVALFGTGPQAVTQLEAVCCVRPVRAVRVCSRRPERAVEFAADAGERHGIETTVATAEEAVRGADIVVSATSATTPVFEAEWVEPGCHVTSVGSFTPEMIELPPELCTKAKVVVDELEAAQDEAGEIIKAVRLGLFTWDDVYAELGDLVRGVRPGRESADEVTWFKSVGLAVQDVAVAARVLQAAQERGVGSVVEL